MLCYQCIFRVYVEAASVSGVFLLFSSSSSSSSFFFFFGGGKEGVVFGVARLDVVFDGEDLLQFGVYGPEIGAAEEGVADAVWRLCGAM